nr:probable terpene synthase 9 [Ziziphus jujuba var. spinosa]
MCGGVQMAELPLYMKICYVAMLHFANELVYDVLKSHGFDILPYIKQEWLNLCRSYLKEARWFYCGCIPSVEEYLENSKTSVGGPAAMIHACLLLGSPITKTSLQFLNRASNLIYSSSLVTRLWDDLGTSKAESKRGDVAKAIQCYMVEKRISEEEAKEEINELISYSWKTLNQECLSNQSLPKTFVNLSLDMARTSHFIFQRGDGIGTSTGLTKTRLVSLIVKPISIPQNGI